MENIPAIANSDAEAQIHSYGDAVVVRADRGSMKVLRIWVKRATGWRAGLYQEVLQVEKSEPAGGRPTRARRFPTSHKRRRKKRQSPRGKA